jgi:hypothetical protein
MPWLIRAWAVWAGCQGASCSESIFLGSECSDGECRTDAAQRPEPDADPDADPKEDADPPDEPDAGDAEVEAGPAEPGEDAGGVFELPVLNGRFERGGGVDGDLVVRNLFVELSTTLGIPLVEPVFAMVPHWYACVPFVVSSSSTPIEGASLSSSSGDYLTFTPNLIPVLPYVFHPARQELETPLRKGQRGFITIDAITRSQGTEVVLQLRGASRACTDDGVVLGQSAVLEDSEDWTSTCIPFEIDEDFTFLLIQPVMQNPMLGQPAPTVLLDTVRPASKCPD